MSDSEPNFMTIHRIGVEIITVTISHDSHDNDIIPTAIEAISPVLRQVATSEETHPTTMTKQEQTETDLHDIIMCINMLSIFHFLNIKVIVNPGLS